MAGNTWMIAFIETFKATHHGREPSKVELRNATPLFVTVDTNMKGKGTMAYDRFQGYLVEDAPTTIGEAFANGLRPDDIRHDSERRYILLGDEAQAMYDALDENDETIEGEFEVVSEVPALPAPEVKATKGKK